eukprot:3297103-Amphidinium_carterae.1
MRKRCSSHPTQCSGWRRSSVPTRAKNSLCWLTLQPMTCRTLMRTCSTKWRSITFIGKCRSSAPVCTVDGFRKMGGMRNLNEAA